MKAFLTTRAIALLAILLPGAHAIYKDDAGVLDFSVATAGHGAFEWARSIPEIDLLITTDGPTSSNTNTNTKQSSSSCFVAGRSLSTGNLRWRRNVCSVSDSESRAHGIAMSGDGDGDGDNNNNEQFYTVDNAGVVRAWTVDNGDLLWDAKVAPGSSSNPRVFAVPQQNAVAVASGDSELVLLDATTGTTKDTIGVDNKEGRVVEWFSVKAAASGSSSSLSLAYASVAAGGDTFAGKDFAVASYETGGALKASSAGTLASGAKAVVVDSVLEESATSSTVLIGTERGTTTVLKVSSSSIEVLWTAEEGLASVSSAIILDASHMGSDDLVEEQDEVAYKLSLAGRWKAQWQELTELVSTANGLIGTVNSRYRDHLFGFLKVSALLSSKSHRLWGMSTAGEDRGAIRWSLDLPKSALWHSMVHGTTNAAKAAHGIHGDTHSREILVLSALSDRVEWMCIDGTSGAVNARDTVPISGSSSIAQVVPVYGTSTGGCRQAALLLGADASLTTVPADEPTAALVQKQLHKTPNGLYTHKVDRVANTVESYRVSSSASGSLSALPVGMASFGGEQIVKVAYPLRHEDMQSMSTILGDNSLLLKYINPHMAVVVTMVQDPDQQSETDVARALQEQSKGATKPRKPVGAGAPGASTATPPSGLPNMFVNLVDTVSGRVLYRHGHSNVDAGKTVSVVVSENWVVYTYVNDKTRRTEIGVLTLHEGMIEPKGLTYFSRPEQSSSFSSFDARESKPVVLSKVYAFPKAVTALGVTQTKQGISRQNILLASADGALSTLNKMILETRRPVGEAKPNEKKEGLMPYRELIPASPLFSLNYNQTMEPFPSIVSATTALESQSLVFGFGGADLFFARTSPTKGFDLLPETFNKGLVGATTVGIVAALFFVQRMGEKKALKQSWS
eukprot:jgi/Psemu1/317813/estExt_fgenesh1_pm.C_280025